MAEAVAASVEPWTAIGTIKVRWHGGEPLTLGAGGLGALLDCFTGLKVEQVSRRTPSRPAEFVAEDARELACVLLAMNPTFRMISVTGPFRTRTEFVAIRTWVHSGALQWHAPQGKPSDSGCVR
ncbi:hypothetical protein AB0F91_46730 [Amycolatopsis sp. NPDC023774]|uniref:hypothetical protein n=1 Tax=Amycolatopsis sp. NPDC023774 TaxID=3155015 RepID=UPI0034023157